MKGNSTSLEDAFIKISFEEEPSGNARSREGDSDSYAGWVGKASAPFARPGVIGANLFRKLHPGHSVVMSVDYGLNVLSYPGAVSIPIKPDEVIANTLFIPLSRHVNGIPGVLADSVEFGCFRTAWDKYEFTIYVCKFLEGYGTYFQHYILHEGPEQPARLLLLTAGAWAAELHEEIWVFNNGFWQKNHDLWAEIQKSNWDDVILEEEKKKAIQKDIYSFFDSEELYKSLGIAWKRGLIFWGPPGNGKTVSLKTVMKTIQDRGYNPLYVKSFVSWRGEEGSMEEVFGKARQLAPCVVILEDLDSLINDRNRSFFLNQLDGIEGNDGLLIIATTNHLDRIDSSLTSRPSRFDRKYLFDDPDKDERLLYAKYWQGKLISNDKIVFTDSLVNEISELTYGFSFAYLKECFVSSLVILATEESKTPFEQVIKGQIKVLRKELNKSRPSIHVNNARYTEGANGIISGYVPLPPKPDRWEMVRTSVSHTAASMAQTGRTFLF